MYKARDIKTNSWIATFNLKTSITNGTVIVLDKKIKMLAIPFHLIVNLCLNCRKEFMVDTRDHIDAINNPSQTINNALFDDDMIGPYISCSVTLVSQCSNKNQQSQQPQIKQLPSRVDVSNINVPLCDSLTTIKPGDLKTWVKSSQESGVILVYDVAIIEKYSPSFCIRFQNFWTVRQWCEIIAIKLSLPDTASYETIIRTATRSPNVIDPSSCLGSLLTKILFNQCDLDSTYIASSKKLHRPSFDKQTKQRFTVTELCKNIHFIISLLHTD